MKFNKYKGFSLAELMIMLAVLTILLAAFAPIFTARYKNAALENVWSYIGDDDEFDAYSDQVNKTLPAQLFIGMQPGGKSEVLSSISDGTTSLYSKLVIRASDRLEGTDNEKQKQIRFQYGDSKEGTVVGTLFAGSENLLLGGEYANINKNSETAKGNTSFGYNTLSAITTGKRNSVLGDSAGSKLTTGDDNTLIGYKAGANLNTNGNTIIGTETSSTLSFGSYNTSIGNFSGPVSGLHNTIVGDYAATSLTTDGNTAVGYQALLNASGGYNTAVGAYAMSKYSVGSWNTAIGYGACSALSGAFAKTCIGANSGSYAKGSNNDFLLNDATERVYIGAYPVYTSGVAAAQTFGGAAVLEVHNPSGKSNTGVSNMGASSVVINGNLIVRGQPFMTVPSYFYNGAALVGFKQERPKEATKLHTLMGYDGHRKDMRVNGRKNRRHAKYGGHTNCTCARPCGSSSKSSAGYTSYDWSTTISDSDYQTEGFNWHGSYTDASTGETCKPRATDHESEEIDLNYAHGRADGTTCCPILTSDIRLKDLTDSFIGGLAEIKKINVYNYTFKSDSDKLPHVGVIAQDLKRVFPTAVSKDKNGYYQIRWDELLYAAINAVKTLDSKIDALASRVSKDKSRIAALKKDNAELNLKLDELSVELAKLEEK